MQIALHGDGYLGTVTAACLADFGNPVTTLVENEQRIALLSEGRAPFFEKDLEEMLRRNLRAGRLVYSDDVESVVARAQVIYLADDSYRFIEETAVRLARHSSPEAVLVILTPVPVGTSRRIQQRLQDEGIVRRLVTQPVFLTDGCAVEDFNWPDRIVLGSPEGSAVMLLKQIYHPLVMRGTPILVTTYETAELLREASTAFIATKVSFINELAMLCEHVGADAVQLAQAMGLDKKIGPRCLQPGMVLGGSSVAADLDLLNALASGKGVSLKVLNAARQVNATLSDRVMDKLHSALENLSGKEIGILGMAFKPHTNSVVSSASVLLARRLLAGGAKVRAYDPVALPQARTELSNLVRYTDSAYSAAEGADALVVATGWPEFKALDLLQLRRNLRRPVLVDTKNLFEPQKLRALGFEYAGMGRN